MFSVRHSVLTCFYLTLMGLTSSLVWAQRPTVGPNINMVSGTKWPAGDPFLTKQNEPSIAVSSLNAQHLLAGANDYRLVDLSQAVDIPGETGAGDAWVFMFTSADGGASWKSRAMSGCPLNVPQCNSPLSSAIKGRQFAADPTVRPGPYGTFFLSFIAANRGTSTNGLVGVQRFIDRNNNVNIGDDPIAEDVVNVIDTGTSGQFKDKPWVIADVGGRSWNGSATCRLPGYAAPVPAFNVYVSYSNFVGNSSSNPHPQILVATSHDCGQTFDKATKVSNSVDTNSGSTVTIDPVSGAIYVIWRRFGDASTGSPDAIYVSKSTNGGSKFSNPSLVAKFQAFDQGTSAYSFRTNALPSAAVSVDASGNSRVHAVWSQRKANGDARIAMSTSRNGGNSWTTPTYLDDWATDPINPANPGRGHQFQPTVTFAGGKLMAAWFDQRYDYTVGILECPANTTCTSISQFVERRQAVGALATGGVNTVFTPYLTDVGLTRRHTIDTFSAMADPSDQPAFQSSRVSQFLYGNVAALPKGSKQIRQLRFNVPNVPIFVNNSRSFLGDYLDVAAQSIVPSGNAAQPYKFNTTGPEKPVFHLTWTDNRDVVPPLKQTAAWQNTPSAIFVLNADGSVTTAPNPNCVPGLDGSKNQNIYTAKVGEGVAGYVQVNSKDLSATVARGFVVGVQNLLTTNQTFKLNIGNQPVGGYASFDQNTINQNNTLTQLTITVPPRSSAARVVWVTSTSLRASITVTISDAAGSLLKSLVLNPDPGATGSFLPNPAGDISNNDLTDAAVKNVELTNVELTNVELTNVELTNVELTNVELTNVELTNVELTNVELTNVELTNVELTNVELTNVELTNVELTNNTIQNVELTNGGMADTTFTVSNRGTVDTTLNIKTLLKDQRVPDGYKLELVMRKVAPSPSAQMSAKYLARPTGQCKIAFLEQNVQNANIPDPKIADPADPLLGQFLVQTPNAGDDNNATLPLLAGEKAQITMRILGPSQAEANAFGQNAIKFIAVGARGTITPIPLIIKTLSLSAGTALTPYSIQLQSFGGAGAVTWCPNAGQCVLPAWLAVSATGALTGTPPVSGTFLLTVRVADSGSNPQQSDVQQLALVINPAPQTITFPTPLPLTLNVGETLILDATSPGGPVTFSASGSCQVTGNTLTTVSAGLCTVIAMQAGSTVYATVTVTNTITVNKGNQTINFDSIPNKTFGDSAFSVTATATSGLPVSLTAIGSCSVAGSLVSITAAGSCSITASQPGDTNYNAATSVIRPFTIAQAASTITLLGLSQTYTGAPRVVTATTTPSGLGVSILYGGSATAPTNAGSYTVTAAVTSANYTGSASGTLVVSQATAVLTFGGLAQVYDGTAKAVTVTTTPPGLTTVAISYTGAHTDVGSYPVSATLTNLNYAGAVSGTLVISQTAAVVTLGNLDQNFDGTPKSATVTTAPAGLTYSVTYGGSATAPSAAGSYAVVATVTNPNFAGSATGTLLIRQALFSPTGAMTQPRTLQTATLLTDGKVLVTGGLDASGSPTATAEIWESATGTFLGVGNMPSKSAGHAASLLADGRVLITGGGNGSSEIYNPPTQSFSPGGGLSSNRSYHTSTTLLNGTVLIVGGSDNSGKTFSSTVIYDPAAGSFTSGPNLTQDRERHTATLLPNGKVLIAGGRYNQGKNYRAVAGLEIYDPATNAFSNAGSLATARYSFTAVLSGGDVVFVGGTDGTSDLNSAERYTIATGAVSGAGTMSIGRSSMAAAPISGGRILVTGGQSGATVLANTEIRSSIFTAGPAMGAARANHTATVLSDGRVLVTGGTGASGGALNSVEIFSSIP
ncbi:MAG: MBG domain-containing protein [Bryobacteraceae bacterium]